jgi:hypothetical protein
MAKCDFETPTEVLKSGVSFGLATRLGTQSSIFKMSTHPQHNQFLAPKENVAICPLANGVPSYISIIWHWKD